MSKRINPDKMRKHSGIKVIARLMGMTGALLGMFGLYNLTLAGDAAPSVFETVYSHCVLILISLNYYCLCKMLYFMCSPSSSKAGRRSRTTPMVSTDGPGYVDVDDMRSVNRGGNMDIVKGLPRLTIHNVWVLVYGLGFVFFVTGYCMMGIQPVCLACAGIALGILSVDELISPKRANPTVYLVMRWAALIAGLTSMSLVSINLIAPSVVQYAGAMDFYSIFFGLCLPFVAQFIMIAVRDTRHYSLGTVMQLCEFGFPFTAFLGIFHLSVAYGQRYQIKTDVEVLPSYQLYGSLLNQSLDGYYQYWQEHNMTAQTVIRTDGPFLLFYSLAPLLMVPTVVCYVECALDGCSIDPMISLNTALCVQHFISSSGEAISVLGIYGTVCCLVAIVARIMCEYLFIINEQAIPSLQCESTHLTQQVVWERDARRSQEMQELTRDLDDDLERDLNSDDKT